MLYSLLLLLPALTSQCQQLHGEAAAAATQASHALSLKHLCRTFQLAAGIRAVQNLVCCLFVAMRSWQMSRKGTGKCTTSMWWPGDRLLCMCNIFFHGGVASTWPLHQGLSGYNTTKINVFGNLKVWQHACCRARPCSVIRHSTACTQRMQCDHGCCQGQPAAPAKGFTC